MKLRGLFILWTLVVFVSLGLSAYRVYADAEKTARIEASAHFNQVVNMRHWVASLGGVYAPITEQTQPNPFLVGKVAERDITTPLGKELTLLNPAYVTRLLAAGLVEKYQVHARLVSTNPVWEQNRADAWETRAIGAFLQKQKTEVIEISGDFKNADHMRYIAPLYLQQGCMGCHAAEGKVGDLRGAISVSIPMAPHYEVALRNARTITIVYGGIWIFGLGGISFFGRKINHALERLRDSESVLKEAQGIAHLGSWSLDHKTQVLEWSDEIYNIFGYHEGHIIATYENFLERVHPDERSVVDHAYWESVRKNEPYDIVHRIVRKDDGGVRYVRERCKHDCGTGGDVLISIGTVQDITDRVLAEQKIHQLAFQDVSTGMPNETKFLEGLGLCINKDAVGFVASIELAGMGDIVGTFGLEGSELIVYEMGIRLNREMNASSIVAKVGPRLFKILYVCEDGEKEHIRAIAQRLFNAAQEPFDLMGSSVLVNVYMGTAIIDSGTSTPQMMVTQTEMALHAANRSPQSEHVYYQPSIQEQFRRNTQLVSWMRTALATQVFKMFFQPQIDLRTNVVVGCEALIRWPVTSEEWITPGEFIPIAEKSGLIGDITRWTVEESCRIAASWFHEHGIKMRTGINISAEELASEDFFAYLSGFVKATKLPMQSFEIEITETALMKDVVVAGKNLQKIRDLGIGIAVDDFGTGQASMAYLKQFPIDKLKIDQAFIKGAPNDKTDQEIITSIITLAHTLGIGVIAEGAENKEHIDLLTALGCDEVQGYYLGRPMSADDFLQFVKNYPQ